MERSQLASRSVTSSGEPYCPDAGDLISINFDPQAGREMAGRHFALVLSKRQYNRVTRLCVAVPVTGQVKGFPFEVALPGDLVLGTKNGGGCVLSDQIKSLSWTDRGARFICAAPADILPEVLAKVRALLGI
jgi:mRNA interferase MazF